MKVNKMLSLAKCSSLLSPSCKSALLRCVGILAWSAYREESRYDQDQCMIPVAIQSIREETSMHHTLSKYSSYLPKAFVRMSCV